MRELPDVVTAFTPPVAGIAEVLHARWKAHSYPLHTHDTWTVLMVDDGVVGYAVDRRAVVAPPRSGVTILPPGVPHDGHPMTDGGFRKRVLYLELGAIDERLVGASVLDPFLDDPGLRAQVSGLDRALLGHDWFEASTRLALTTERISWHLAGRGGHQQSRAAGPRLGAAVREWLDADLTRSDGLAPMADELGVTVPHLIRSFTRTFGIAPHRYLLSRRIEHARRLLLADVPASQVAARAGFYDQAHLNRHFRAFLGTTPAGYQRSGRAALAVT